MTVDAWVHQLNRRAEEMDSWCAVTHLSGWHEMLALIAKAPCASPGRVPVSADPSHERTPC